MAETVETAARGRASRGETPLLHTLALRILKEVAMGAIAVIAALVVIVPVLFVVTVLYNRLSIYAVLVIVILTGAALLFYQAQLRPRLR
jgi:hypothetical protein